MKVLLTVVAALCLVWADAAFAGDETSPNLLILTQGGEYQPSEDALPVVGEAESSAEPLWVASHRLALAVARQEARRPQFDESTPAVFLEREY